jgi:TRAP-type C4-dicarboxylate transport system substrate-binding protein
MSNGKLPIRTPDDCAGLRIRTLPRNTGAVRTA